MRSRRSEKAGVDPVDIGKGEMRVLMTMTDFFTKMTGNRNTAATAKTINEASRKGVILEEIIITNGVELHKSND
jgi:hypothetical protein